MEAEIREYITGKFGKIIEVLKSGYLLIDREGNIRDVNPSFCEITGYGKEELLSMNVDDLRYQGSDDYQQTFFETIIDEESTDFEMQHITKNGETAYLWGSATAIEIDGERFIAEFLRDITEKKEEERKQDAIFNLMYQFIGLMEPDGTLLEANETARKFGGLDEEEVIGKPFWEAHWWQVDESTKDQLKESIKKAADGEFVRYEVDVLGRGDTVETIDFSIKPVFDEEGEVELLIPEGRIITEKKEVKAKLKQSEQQLNSLFEHNPLPVYLFDLEGNFIRVNEKLAKFTGKSREELLRMNFASFIHEEDLEKTMEHFRLAASGTATQYEIRVTVQEGNEKEIQVTKFPMYKEGQIKGVYGIFQDVTEEKEANRKLKESEQRWQHLVTDNPQPVQVTVDGVVKFINEAGAKVYGMESPEEIVGRSVFEFLHPEEKERIRSRMKKLERGESVDKIEENRVIQPDGEVRYVEVNSIPIEYQGQKAIQTVIHDITERRKKEQIIKNSLKEKEVLLKEIHHRVKNNMAVISGLLELQAMNTKEEKIRTLLKESQFRISSMAMIHEKLYQTESLSKIEFDKYIKELVQSIQYSIREHTRDVVLKYDLEKIYLNVNQAIPTALMLNELVVNVYKHAFNDNRAKKRELAVGLSEESSVVELTISDNGEGLPEGFDLEGQDTLGMRLVNTLKNQLEGKLEVSSALGEGSSFRLVFEKE